MSLNDESVCGETYDHDLTTEGPVDGMTVYRCRRCGAEILTEDDDCQHIHQHRVHPDRVPDSLAEPVWVCDACGQRC